MGQVLVRSEPCLGQVWVRPVSGLGQIWGQVCVRYVPGLGQVWIRPGSGLDQVWVRSGFGRGRCDGLKLTDQLRLLSLSNFIGF